MLGQLLADRWV